MGSERHAIDCVTVASALFFLWQIRRRAMTLAPLFLPALSTVKVSIMKGKTGELFVANDVSGPGCKKR